MLRSVVDDYEWLKVRKDVGLNVDVVLRGEIVEELVGVFVGGVGDGCVEEGGEAGEERLPLDI